MKSVAVIGAGVSGLVSIKACLEEGLDVTCYEKYDDYGGLWRYRDEGVSVAKTTVMNTSKDVGAFSDFPPPDKFPQYMSHQINIQYLEMYAKKFRLNSKICYLHEVLNVTKAVDYEETGKWNLQIRNNKDSKIFEKTFDAVMICIGHHDFPHIPAFPGMENYQGRIVHTRNYKTAEGCEGKPALVIGIGNSGADAAVDMSELAKTVYLCARSCFWAIPRLTKDKKPGDAAYRRRPIFTLQYKVPYFLLKYGAKCIMGRNIDDISYNVKPDDLILRHIPVVNDFLSDMIREGKVILKGKVERFTTDGVLFEGDSGITKIDIVVLATGYDVKLPLISPDLIDTSNESLDLYKFIFPPQLQHFSLGLIGFIQPYGAVFPIFELQARLFVMMLMNKVRRPTNEEMIRDVKTRTNLQDFGRWKCMKVEWIQYLDEISSLAQVRPNFCKMFFTDPALFWKCYFGPCLPYQYRLNGHHPWKPARNTIMNYDFSNHEIDSCKKTNYANMLVMFSLFSVFIFFISIFI